MEPKFFDIHAHVNDVRFDDDRDDVFERMREHDVFAINVGTDRKSSEEVVKIAESSGGRMFASIGVHPIDDINEEFNQEAFSKIANSSTVVSIGECGLDYSRIADALDTEAEKKRQKKLFESQVDFAIERNLPLMVHCRDSEKALADAHHDVLKILVSKKVDAGNRLRGNIHFFSQTIEIAQEYFALDFTVSFTGVITFAREYDDVVKNAPLNRLMAETDCPYVAPLPYRGKRNEPIYVQEVVKKIAELRGEDFEAVRAELAKNAFRVFGITK